MVETLKLRDMNTFLIPHRPDNKLGQYLELEVICMQRLHSGWECAHVRTEIPSIHHVSWGVL